MPLMRSRKRSRSPNATSTAGAPLLCGCSLPSARQNFSRSAKNRMPLACFHTGSNHAASVRACSNAVPQPCLARRWIQSATAYRSKGGFNHTRPHHGCASPLSRSVKLIFAQGHGPKVVAERPEDPLRCEVALRSADRALMATERHDVLLVSPWCCHCSVSWMSISCG